MGCQLKPAIQTSFLPPRKNLALRRILKLKHDPLEGAKHPSCPSAFQQNSVLRQIRALEHRKQRGIPPHTNSNYSNCNAGSPLQPWKSKHHRAQIQKPGNKRDRQRVGELPKITIGGKQTASTSVESRRALFQLQPCKVIMGGRQ